MTESIPKRTWPRLREVRANQHLEKYEAYMAEDHEAAPPSEIDLDGLLEHLIESLDQ